MDNEVDLKDLIKAAREFAKKQNRGLSSRIREKIDAMNPALQVLVNERLPIKDIQEFIRQHTGMKIGLPVLKQYMQETFGYPPPTKPGGRSDSSTDET
jgi:hypothetical protein